MKKLYKLNELDLDQMLLHAGMPQPWIDKHRIKYEILITKILFKSIFYPGKKYHRLSMEELRNKLGKVRIAGKLKWMVYVIRDHLKKAGVILWHNSHITKCSKYTFFKITDEFLEKGWSRSETEITSDIMARMEKVVEYTGVYATMQRVIMSVEVDYQGAKSFLKEALRIGIKLKSKKKFGVYKKRKMNLTSYSHWLMALDVINDGIMTSNDEELRFHVDLKKTGRVFHAIAYLPKPLRKFIRINGRPLIELDIKNCQPLLFVPLLKKWAQENNCHNAQDIILYQELCEKGEFYKYVETLIRQSGLPIKLDYNEFKQEFFGRIFFSSETKKYKWRTVFEKEFPNVSACITSLKVSDYKKMSIALQKQESDIIVLNVCKKLYDNGHYDIFSLHDAVYCTEQSLEAALLQIHHTFSEYSLSPSIGLNRLVKQISEAA